MKIIIIPHYPGKASRHYCIAKELINQGHEVHYMDWSLPYKITANKLLKHLFTSLIPGKYVEDNITMHKAIRLPFFWPVINGWIFKYQLRKLFKKLDADIIFAESYTNETEVPKDLPFIYDLADDYAAPADVYGSPIYKFAFKILGIRNVMKKHTQNALAVTAVSNILYNYAKQYNQNVSKSPNGVDTEIIKKILKDKSIQHKNNYSMIYVTAFNQWSRPIEAMKAVIKLRKEFSSLSLTLIGEGIKTDEIKTFIKENKAEKFIFYLGKINDREKLFNLINQHTIGLNISVKNKFRDAAHPMKVIEYCALGKKVVSTDLDEVKTLRFPNIYTFSDNNKVNSLENVLRRALKDKKNTYKSVSELVLKEYKWKKIVAKLTKISLKKNSYKVIHVTPAYPPDLGGLEKVVQALARTQSKNGMNVEVITSNQGRKEKIRKEDFPVKRMKNFVVANTRIMPGLLLHLLKIKKTDIVHLHISSAFMPELIWFSSKIKRFKYIVHLHLDLEPLGPAGILLKIYKPLLLKYVLRSAGFVVVFTDEQKEKIQKQYAIDSSRIEIIPNGVEKKFFSTHLRKLHAKPRLLFVGRLEKQKNVQQLLHALKGISNKFETYIVGDGSLLNDLKNLVNQLGLMSINFVGRADGNNLLQYYKTSDIFVLPSEREGMPLALLEATAMGMPIIATNVPGNRDVVRDSENGYLSPLKDISAFKNSLVKVGSNKKLYAKFSKASQIFSKEFTWEKTANEFKKLYEKIQINNLQKTEENVVEKSGLKQWYFVLSLLLLANGAYFLNNFVGWIVTLIFFLLIPGYLLLCLFKHELQSRWEIISLSFGFSLLLIMLGGLTLNTLNVVGLKQPLTTPNIFAMLDIVTLALLFLNRKRTIIFKNPKFHFSNRLIFMSITLTLLPFLAAGGAISLNNGGPNTLTMTLFALIPILFMFLIWRKELKPLYPYAIFMMGTAILFTNSLRGWFSTGHDIHHEFAVFQHTFNNNLWIVRLATGDPYNSCLSITILPTIIAKITNIPSQYIYKLVFQIIFGFGIVSTYLFINKISNPIKALIGSFLFLTFPTFLDDMSFLNRQEIAYIFFGLLMLISFSKIAKKTKIIITTLLLLGIIISHYSSSYVMGGILSLSWLIYYVLKKFNSVKGDFEIPILRLPIIIGALLFTFIWNSQITVSAQNLQGSISQTFSDFRYHKAVSNKFLSYNLFSSSSQNPQDEFARYALEKGSNAQYVPIDNLPLTNLGKYLSRFINVQNFNTNLHSWIAKIMQLLLIFGLAFYAYTFIKRRNYLLKIEIYYYALFGSSIMMLAIFTLLPRLSVDYSIIRLIQQTLIITALPIVLTTELFFFYSKFFKQYITLLIFIILFLHSSGFIPQLTGGYKPQLSLNNAGQYYDYFYTHKSDVLGARWLAQNQDKSISVFHDVTSNMPVLGYYVKAELLRSDTRDRKSINSSYFFDSYINVEKNIFRTFRIGDFTEYTDSTVTSNRNLLYSNGESKIYGFRLNFNL